jgi:hypothetical protein
VPTNNSVLVVKSCCETEAKNSVNAKAHYENDPATPESSDNWQNYFRMTVILERIATRPMF